MDRDRELDALRTVLRLVHLQIETLHELVSDLRLRVDEAIGQQVGNEPDIGKADNSAEKEKTPGDTGGSDE